MNIGILSDTHGTIPPQVYDFFCNCDELWHCGDLGSGVLETLQSFKPTRAVFGNTDGYPLRHQVPERDLFTREGQRILMTHIGGWPGHYPKEIQQLLSSEKPDIFVCGHSHILKVMFDKDYNLLHINPGAAGCQGFHNVSTLVRFTLNPLPSNVEVLDFPKFPPTEHL